MRSPDEFRFARLTRGLLTVSLGAIAAGCSGGAGEQPIASTVSNADIQRTNGPNADYPIVIGEPYLVGDTEYVPADTLNYDHVGYATLDGGAMGYTGAHHTLPLPSYVEVTALDTGRTILIRLERRGPMASNHLVALSPAAMAQLGANGETPVRVRRTVPPEEQRFLLRSGQAAPIRMDTPASLLTVLQRRLPTEGEASLRASTGSQFPSSRETVAQEALALPASTAAERPMQTVEVAPSVVADPSAQSMAAPEPEVAAASPAAIPELPPLDPLAPAATSVQSPVAEEGTFAGAYQEPAVRETTQSTQVLAALETSAPVSDVEPERQTPDAVPVTDPDGRFVVQAAAFSTRERADRVASVIEGRVSQSGRFFRVRTGPFATRGEAEASLANVRRAGYTDARIFTNR